MADHQSVGIILFSGTFIWRFFGGSTGAGLLVAWITSVSFFPFLLCWGVGQTSCLVLLGVVFFLLSDRVGNPWLGAAGLLLVSFKPQNVYLFCLVVSVWVLRERNWKLPAASAVLLGVAAGILTLLRPPLGGRLPASTRATSPLLGHPNRGRDLEGVLLDSVLGSSVPGPAGDGRCDSALDLQTPEDCVEIKHQPASAGIIAQLSLWVEL